MFHCHAHIILKVLFTMATAWNYYASCKYYSRGRETEIERERERNCVNSRNAGCGSIGQLTWQTNPEERDTLRKLRIFCMMFLPCGILYNGDPCHQAWVWLDLPPGRKGYSVQQFNGAQHQSECYGRWIVLF